MTELPDDLEQLPHDTSEDELEKELVLIGKLLDKTSDENRAYAAYRIILQAVLFGTECPFQAVGMLEEARREYTDLYQEAMAYNREHENDEKDT